MIKISYKPTFIRQLKKLPEPLQIEAKEKIKLLEEDPDTPSLKVHKLKGRLKGRLSFSVNYSYRILFQYYTKQEIVLLNIGDHQIYQ